MLYIITLIAIINIGCIAMMQVMKIEKKEGCRYILNEAGDILELSTVVTPIGSVKKKAGFSYSLMADGSVVEQELVVLDPDTFYSYKQSGKLAQLYREGKDVRLDEGKATLGALEEFEKEDFRGQLKGALITDATVQSDAEGRLFVLELDNGKTLVLREGLLAKGSVVELK